MTSLFPFYQLADLCVSKGIEDVIICPGSRNAPLTIAFTENKSLNCISISDERSAAFIALGMSLMSNKPTVIICTSGTAALNFSPAIAEAYFLEVPLLVLTADRPPEWIHQYDGQTIFQTGIYGTHVKKSADWLPDQSSESLIYANRLSNELLNTSVISPKGPVHLNIPIREPFYGNNEESNFAKWRNVEFLSPKKVLDKEFFNKFLEVLNKSPKRLLVIGQGNNWDKKLITLFAQKFGFVFVSDSISNTESDIKMHDFHLKSLDEIQATALNPDFVLSFGKSLISKSLKLFLRNSKPANHWQVQENERIIDPTLSITRLIDMLPMDFLKQLIQKSQGNNVFDSNYNNVWQLKEELTVKKLATNISKLPFGEFKILASLLPHIPEYSIIHSGNSMSIRYLNLLSLYISKNVNVYCNRGTSGIDGSLSTAVGQALKTDKTVFCILGDVSFQYDKNALWNTILPDNLKIVILNNAGGIIFRMIEGPKNQSTFSEFFQTKQPQNAELLAQMHDLNYYKITDDNNSVIISQFISDPQKSILEIFSDAEKNEVIYKRLFEN